MAKDTHVNIHLDDQGSGPTVVMIHGLGGSANTFEAQASALSGSYRVIRPDLPGAARSGGNAAKSLEGLADQLVETVAAIAPQAHWVGHSLGSVLCQWVAAKHPEQVASLALVGPFWEAPPAAQNALRQRAGRVRARGMADFADEYLGVALAAHTASAQPTARAYLRESLQRTPAEVYATYCELLAAHRAVDLAALHMRTLLVTGDEDTVSPVALVERMNAVLPLSTMRVLPACGHWAPLEAAYELTAVLRDHFERG